MSRAHANPQIGDSGEKVVRSQLERAIFATGHQLSGHDDKGVDLVLQFPSPSPLGEPLFFGVQVKTGDSFVTSKRGRWRVKPAKLDATRFSQWQRSTFPVLFVWVRPTNPVTCYWRVVRRNSDPKNFTISKSAVISPVTRFDLALELFHQPQTAFVDRQQVLRLPLSKPLRPHAKMYYREIKSKPHASHQLLGETRLTWNAWRHLTSNRRPAHYIQQSLQLLPLTRWTIENATEFIGIRRLNPMRRGDWVTDRRLIAFRARSVPIHGRSPADVIIVFREVIRHPADWQNSVTLHEHVYREVTLESIYEKAAS